MTIKQKILDVVSDNDKKTGGHCGIKPVEIAHLLEMNYVDIRESLTSLYNEGKFKVREGINGHLIFKS